VHCDEEAAQLPSGHNTGAEFGQVEVEGHDPVEEQDPSGQARSSGAHAVIAGVLHKASEALHVRSEHLTGAEAGQELTVGQVNIFCLQLPSGHLTWFCKHVNGALHCEISATQLLFSH
jgi:hypothetical protein